MTADAGVAAAPVIVGLQVASPTGEPLGTVIEIVADPTTGAPVFAVISTEGETAAVPYSAAASMVHDDALVMDQARLAAAPRVDQGETRTSGEWTSESNAYWGQGEVRTASPDTSSDPGAESSTETEPRG